MGHLTPPILSAKQARSSQPRRKQHKRSKGKKLPLPSHALSMHLKERSCFWTWTVRIHSSLGQLETFPLKHTVADLTCNPLQEKHGHDWSKHAGRSCLQVPNEAGQETPAAVGQHRSGHALASHLALQTQPVASACSDVRGLSRPPPEGHHI